MVVLVALKSGHLSAPGQRQPRYGLRLGLGVVALAAGIYLVRRGPKPRPARQKKPGVVSRWAAKPRPLTAFASGLLVFAPSETRAALTADLLRATADRATLLITHELRGLDEVDEIVVLDRGRVAGRGTHAELLAGCPLPPMWEAEQALVGRDATPASGAPIR